MDIASIQLKFADELAQIRAVKSPRSRKYSAELRKAICDLHADGIPVERIQKQLGLSGGAFKNWFTRPASKKSTAFTPIALAAGAPKLPPMKALRDLLVIELPSGVHIKIRH